MELAAPSRHLPELEKRLENVPPAALLSETCSPRGCKQLVVARGRCSIMGSWQGGLTRGPTASAGTLVDPLISLFTSCGREGSKQQRSAGGAGWQQQLAREEVC